MADERRVNGNAVSWGSIKMRLAGEPYFGFTAVAFSDKIEVALGYGMGAHHGPRVRSKGKYIVDPCKITGWKASVQAARAAVANNSLSGTSYGTVEFDVIVQFVEAGQDPITVELLRCRWIENSESNEENPDPLKEDFVVQPMRILRNGLALYEREDGEPS